MPAYCSLIFTYTANSGKAALNCGPKLQFSMFRRCTSKSGLMTHSGSGNASALPPSPLPASDALGEPGGVVLSWRADGEASVAGSTGMPLEVVLMLGLEAFAEAEDEEAGRRTSRGLYGQLSEREVV